MKDNPSNTSHSLPRATKLGALSDSALKRTRYRSYALIGLAAFWMTAGLAIVAAMGLNAANKTPIPILFPLFALSFIIASIGLLVRGRCFQWFGIFVCVGMMTRPPYGVAMGVVGLWLLITCTDLFGSSKLSHQDLETEQKERQSDRGET